MNREDFDAILEQLDTQVQQATGKHLTEVQTIVLRGAWSDLTYDEMGTNGSGYSSAYLRQDVGPILWRTLSQVLGEKIGKKNFRLAALRWVRQHLGDGTPSQNGQADLAAIAPSRAASPDAIQPGSSPSEPLPSDPVWERIVLPEPWVGRDREMTSVLRLIAEDHCPLIVITGAGGIGKTALASQVAQHLAHQFQIIWRSLTGVASAADFLQDLYISLTGTMPGSQNGSGDCISALVDQLSRRPLLIVIDGLESVCEMGEVGRYRTAFEPLGELLRGIQRRSLQGCLLVTSREIPQEVWLSNYPGLVTLTGLGSESSQALLERLGVTAAPASLPTADCPPDLAAQIHQLLDYCSGNPLVLRTAAIALQTVFNGSLTQLLSEIQQGYVRPQIRPIVMDQMARLSPAEQEVVYGLAIAQEPLSYEAINRNLASQLSRRSLSSTLETLMRRFIVLRDDQSRYLLPPFFAACVLERLTAQVAAELEQGRLEQFVKHGLICADASNFIRDRQDTLILQPIAESLLNRLGSTVLIEQQLQQVLSRLRQAIATAGYGPGNLINLYRRLGLDLEGLDFSHLPIWQACLHDLNLTQVNMARADFSRCTFASRLGSQPLVVIEPQGRYVAIGDRQGQIILWDTHTHRQHPLWSDPGSAITSLAFHPSQPLLASGHSNQRVYLWNIETDVRVTLLLTQGGAVTSLAFSPDGSFLGSGNADGTVQHWHMQPPYLPRDYPNRHLDGVRALCWSADSQRLISRSNDLMVWDVQTGDRLATHPASELSSVGAAFFGQDHEVLFLSSDEGGLKLVNLSRGHLMQVLDGHQDTVGQVVVGRLGSPLQGTTQTASALTSIYIASASSDQTLKVWNLRTGLACLTLRDLEGPVASLDLAPQAQRLVAGGDRAVCVWNLNTGHRHHTLSNHHCRVSALAVSQDGTLLALGNDDHTVKLWDIRTDSYLKTLRDHVGWVTAIALSPDHRCCASGTYEGAIKLWDTQSGQCLMTFPRHRYRVGSLAFSPDGTMLASVGDDGYLKLWQVEAGNCLNSIPAHDDRIHAVQFSPDGQTLATASADHTVVCWQVDEVSTGNKESLPPLAHDDRVQAIAFSATGDRLLSCSADQVTRLWNWRTGQCETIWDAGLRKVYTVSFDEGDRPLACGSDGMTLGIWDVITGECVAAVPDAARLDLVTFSPAQRLLLGLLPQNRVLLWPYGEVSQPRRLEVNQPYQNMNITGATGITEAQRDLLRSLGAVER